jgi:DNA-binding SARP family transcriptional activator/tetratricopeptide (TPR) repeat protein
VRVSAGKQSTVVAALLLRANQIVPAESLSTALWGDAAPPSALASLATYVARLRQALGPELAARIQTVSRGYRLELDPQDEADHLLAAQLELRARALVAEGNWADADEAAAAGLGLWRGDALQDIDSVELCDQFGPYLEDLRMRLEELRIDARLALGDLAYCLPVLRTLTERHPLRDPLYEKEFAALYGAGRRADAQALFRRVRVLLRDELGVEPSRTLRAMHELSLREAPAEELLALLDIGPRTRFPAQGAAAGELDGHRAADRHPLLDHHFPTPPRRFVGREPELAELNRAMAGNRAPEQPGLTLLVGMAGVGKTSLALAWAHKHAAEYPDGRIYLDLKGFAERGTPLDPDTAVKILLDLLGVGKQRLPATAHGRTALYRATLADLNLLIVLDNAADAEQVRALLPVSGGCQVLAASRSSLASLVTIDFARTVRLAPLSAEESTDLLQLRLGPDRTLGHQDAVAAIAQRCAHLPLALVVAAGRAWTRPDISLEELAEQLDPSGDGLAALDGGDPAIDVRTVLSWSYRQLDEEHARLFRLLAVHPGPDISVPAAASLADRPRAEAQRMLVELEAMNMLEPRGPGRYRLHSLLRAFAGEQSVLREKPEQRCAAYRRLVDSYLLSAIDADALLVTHSVLTELRLEPGPGVDLVRFDGPREALDWLDLERETLSCLVAETAAAGLDAAVWQLTCAQSYGLERAARWREELAHGRLALDAARRLGDPVAEAHVLRLFARALARFCGDVDGGLLHVEQALELYTTAGHELGIAESHRTRGNILHMAGEPLAALADLHFYLRYVEENGHAHGRAMAMNSIAYITAHLGREQEALALCRRALDLMLADGEIAHIGHLWDSLGMIQRRLGDLPQAASNYRRAVDAFDDAGNAYQAALARMRLGDVLAQQAQFAAAVPPAVRAGTARPAAGTGAAHSAAEAAADAEADAEPADAAAERVWDEALTVFEELRLPEAAQVRQRLAER